MENNDLPQACQVPFEDLKKSALEHYEEISTKACHWNSLVPKAIMAYDPNRESNEKAFIEWLDKEIEAAEKMSDKEDRRWEPNLSFSGRATALEEVKEKFLSLTTTK
jgi:hypothetical protein